MAASDIEPVRVLLWNVYSLPSILTDGRSRVRVAAISPLLRKYDVVVLNEGFCNKDALLAEAGFDAAGTKRLTRQWYTLFDSGLLVLSRFPIRETIGEHFTHRARWDWFAAKGLLLCRLQLPGGHNLDLVATHMQGGNSAAEQTARGRQADQTAAFVSRHCPADHSVLFCGDLNMGPTADPTGAAHSVHYASPADAIARSAAYERMRVGAGLSELTGGDPDDDFEGICRFLVRGPLARSVHRIPHGLPDGLSDTGPLTVTVHLPASV